MQSTLFYLLQVVICSGVLFGYYQLVLRNKRFHQYNRYYILSILFFSWLVPLIRIPVFSTSAKVYASTKVPQKVWEVIADNNSSFEAYVHNSATGVQVNHFGLTQMVSLVYVAIASLLMMLLCWNIFRVVYLRRQHKKQQVINGVVLVHTYHPKAPFSFFKWIFWNDELNINSDIGSRILQHEMVHVQQKHSFDIVIAYLVTAVGWFNPFFWLCRKELGMIHEFIADEKAVHSDSAALAEMLLAVSLPTSTFPLAHSFFQSPIKRRLRMVSFNPTRSYLRRLLVLPIFAVLVMLVAFRKEVTGFVHMKNVSTVSNKDTTRPADNDIIVRDAKPEKISTVPADLYMNNLNLEEIGNDHPLTRNYVVMIDAGHGGYDGGAVSTSGIKEADIAFQLMEGIKRHGGNSHIKFVFSRTTDEYLQPQTRTAKMDELKADLVISLHANASENVQQKGIEIFVPTSDTLLHYRSSYQLANAMAVALSNLADNVSIHTRQTGIWIVNAAKRPAIIIEAGYLSNPDEASKMQSKTYQEKLVNAILKGLQIYLENAPGC
jgi:N-acetylmuramoyl-L-alanine amidase